MADPDPSGIVRPGEGASPPRDVILMGASAGGLEAVSRVLAGLPSTFHASIAVTLHRSPKHPSMLCDILSSRAKRAVIEPKNGQVFLRDHVYLAPADYHLTFGGGLVFLDHGRKENYARPSIDVMFRSGAENFGPRVIGVILTGHLSDGVAGLSAIKQAGGLSLAQEPQEAHAPSMPANALVFDGVDIVFRLAAGAEVLEKLVAAQGVDAALMTKGARRPIEAPG